MGLGVVYDNRPSVGSYEILNIIEGGIYSVPRVQWPLLSEPKAQ